MTQVFAGAGAPPRLASAIERRTEDRWLVVPGRRVSLAMSGLALASLVIHAGILLFATFGDTPAPSRPEITVELVPEPRPELKPKAPAEPPGTRDAKPPPPKEAETPPEAKADPSKAEPEPPKADSEKPGLRPTATERRLPEPAKGAEPKPEPSVEDKPAEREATMEKLQRELDGLKAEQAALDAEQRQAAQSEPPEAQAAQPPAMLTEPKIGGIPSSFAAVALPGLSEIDGIATDYQQIVFSQLAKAKGIRRHMGVPGTTGVVFSVDASGKLVTASIAHPSGSDALDREALEIVNAAGPFPRPPPGSERSFSANFSFVPQAEP